MWKGRLAVLLAVVAGSLAWTATPTAESTAQSPEQVESCLYQKLSEARGRPIARSSSLDAMARSHSQEMASRRTIYHSDPPAGAGTSYAWGENVGMGPDCQTIHEAFMASSAHRDNILDPDWQLVGLGATINQDTLYITQQYKTTPTQPRRTPPTQTRRTPQPRRTCQP